MKLHERLILGVEAVNSRGCWLWGRSRMSSGYGKLSSGGRADARHMGAHRVAYELLNGAIPAGLVVMHQCDERLCVNPFHLSLGTMQDNSRDMVAKGRNFSPARLRKHCPRGHAYSGLNTKGARICKTCINERRHTK